MPSRPGALAAADFDYNYTPVNDQYPAIAPGNYIVSAGDTLRGIALAVYGDAQLWYLIADANGLQTDAELTVGSSLTIPNKVTNLRNAYDTFKPYEPGKIIGDLTPTLPEPPPPDDDGDDCGGIGFVIVAIVAVVVAMYTAGASLVAMAPEAAVATAAGECTLAGSLAASEGFMSLGSAVLAGGAEGAAGIGAAMIGGAAGSIASQAVGIALGIQDEFSWGNVALAAIGAGVSAGLAAPGSPLAGSTGGMPIVRAMVGSVISQGIGVAVGLQDKFNWKGVAAAGVGAGVSLGLGHILPRAATPFGGLLRETAIGFASGVAKQAVYGGKINFANIAADAFGNALGSSLAYSAMAGNSAAQQEQSLDGALAEAFKTSSIDWKNGIQVADSGAFTSDAMSPTEEALTSLLSNNSPASSYPACSAVITSGCITPEGALQIEIIGTDRIRGTEEAMLEQQRAEFARRMEEAAKAEAAQAATSQSIIDANETGRRDPYTGAIHWSSGAITYPITTPQIESWDLPPGPVATPGAEPSYAARSWGVFQDYGAGFFGTLYDTAKSAATGWKNIVTQPVETIKALAWGATSLAGMSINGYKQIWANPADAYGALKWGSGQALGWLNDQFSGPDAGKFVGQAVAGMLPLGSIKGAGRSGQLSEIESAAVANSTAISEKARAVVFGNQYEGVRELSGLLRDAGLSRKQRLDIINSFEEGSIIARRADGTENVIRFFGGDADELGRFVTPTFPQGNARSVLALPGPNRALGHEYGNTAQYFTQYNLRANARFFEGTVAPNFGKPGGGTQYYVPNLDNLIKP